MRRTTCLTALVTMLAMGAACARDDGPTQADAEGRAQGEEVTITGCLTGAPDRAAFVVTADRSTLASGALHAGSGETPTYTYELVGGTDLAAHVGQQVQVTGRLADRRDEVDIERDSETKQAPGAGATPAVETNEEIEIVVRRLNVTSVTPTGNVCSAAP